MKKEDVEQLKKLINEIINDVENNSIKLTVALKKCHRIFNKVNHPEFEKFVKREIEGSFADENVPSYRIKNSEPIGIFINKYNGIKDHVPLNFEPLLKNNSNINKRPLVYSIPEMEEYLEKTELKELKIEFTQAQLELIKPLVYDSQNVWELKSAYFRYPFASFSQIITMTQNKLIEYLLNIEKTLDRNNDIKGENFFENGEQFSAITALGEIVSNAIDEIILIDSYIDEKTLHFFSNKKANIKLKILTLSKSNNDRLKLFIDAFNSEYQNLEVQSSNAFHDRFLIIDQQFYYHIGASIKDVGKKTFMFTSIEEDFIQKSLKEKFDNEWK